MDRMIERSSHIKLGVAPVSILTGISSGPHMFDVDDSRKGIRELSII